MVAVGYTSAESIYCTVCKQVVGKVQAQLDATPGEETTDQIRAAFKKACSQLYWLYISSCNSLIAKYEYLQGEVPVNQFCTPQGTGLCT